MDISTIFIAILVAGCIGLIGATIRLLLRKREIENLTKNKDKKIENLTKEWKSGKADITNLQSQLATANGKITNFKTEMAIANSGIMNLHNRLVTAKSEITNLKTELTTTIEKRAEVSQSNANAVRRLHVSQISLQASAVAFLNERKKCEQLVESYRNLEQMYNNLSETYNTTVKKSKRNAKWRLGASVVKTGAGLLPGGGTATELGSQLIQFFMGAG